MSKNNNFFTEKEDEIIKLNKGKLTNKDIAKLLGRSESSIKNRSARLGLNKKPSRKFTQEEEDFIRDNFLKMEYSQIAKTLDRSLVSIRTKINNMGLKKYSDSWTEEEDKLLLDTYMSKTAKETAKILNKTESQIQNRIFTLGITKPKYYYNKGFFEVIDTEQKAYWLGFIYADGSVIKREFNKHCLTIGLKEDDFNHLEKFCEALETNNRPTFYKCKSAKTGRQVRIDVSCTKMCLDLINLGCVPNKTYEKIRIPEIDKSLIRHFIRGYIDGDGWVVCNKLKHVNSYNRNIGIISKHINILEDIASEFEKVGIECSVLPRETWFVLNAYGQENLLKLIDYLYRDSTIYLQRKYIKAMEIKNTYCPSS